MKRKKELRTFGITVEDYERIERIMEEYSFEYPKHVINWLLDVFEKYEKELYDDGPYAD